MYEKNQKLQTKIDRQKLSLQKHNELVEKTTKERSKLQEKIEKLYSNLGMISSLILKLK